MAGSDLTAREALDRLAAGLALGRGRSRITARFAGGELAGPVHVTTFRIPPDKLQPAGRGRLDVALLEHVASQLNLRDGELVVEYQEHGGGPQLHWIDLGWELGLVADITGEAD